MVNPDLLILTEAWKEYTKIRPDDPESARRPLTDAWREYYWIIEPAWRGMMKRLLPPVAWNFLSEILWRRSNLRQVWLQEGGWLFTKRGTRRKRRLKGQRRPRIERLNDEVKQAEMIFNQSVPPELRLYIDAVILASSGAIYCEDTRSRKRVVERFRNTYGKLKPAKPWWAPVPSGILQTPWGRKFKS